MGSIADGEIRAFLRKLGERYPKSATLYLLGGGALCLLGSPRRTVDIDYAVEAPAGQTEELVAMIETLANELRLEMEIVPIEEFIPLPAGAGARHQRVGQFGNLAVYIYDPYSIALSKVARGFEADLQDVLFLLRQGIINLDQLSQVAEAALPAAWDFDIDPADLRLYMSEIQRLFTTH
ncbi:MAG: DUF6036 family nucleotidyltransferase [Anaerolineales bacterium]